MEGTHRLILPDGGFLLLESTDQNLDAHIGEQVEVAGIVRETVEGAGEIMTVTDVYVMADPDPDVDVAVDVEDAGASVSPPSSSSPSSPEASESSSPPPTPPPPAASSSAQRISPPPPPPPPAPTVTPDMEAKIKKMSKPKPEGAWTQQYCTSHIGVCFPLRSDYWYHSFGTTTSTLWHVEVGAEEITNLGDGPIAVNLVAGRLDASIADQSVVESGDFVFGYRAWTENRHFEISGPAGLRGAIEYITTHIIPYEPPAQ